MLRTFVLLGAAVTACGDDDGRGAPDAGPIGSAQDAAAQAKVLVLAPAEGDPAPAQAALREALAAHGLVVEASRDPAVLASAALRGYDAVVFVGAVGKALTAPQREGFQRYLQGGGAFAGLHAAGEPVAGWAFYDAVVGRRLKRRIPAQAVEVKVTDAVHPASRELPRRWKRTDAWAEFEPLPRGQVHVLAWLDAAALPAAGPVVGDPPAAWCHHLGAGRSFYTAGGGAPESFADRDFVRHLASGVAWAAGKVEGDCRATVAGRFEKVVLARANNPMELAPLPDGRVIFIERPGVVKVYKPTSGVVVEAGSLAVDHSGEDGLMGVAIDPAFAQNGWVYLFYSPSAALEQRLSRFTLEGDRLDEKSEKIVLRIPVEGRENLHSGGSITFGPSGDLFLSVGDGTNPFASDGYAPVDERPDRTAFDAQRTAGNTSSLRGKILRIRPQPDGTYTIPDGNLFPRDATDARPEIYVMGTRNPFRISVDPTKGWLYWGDVGPDASMDDPGKRGPRGYDEWNQARTPGNYGWPYCTANNVPYAAVDFATKAAGAPFDCAAPRNRSPRNTGRAELPAARPAFIHYPYGAPEPRFAELGTSNSRCAMAGPVYRLPPDRSTARRLPAYYDGSVFIYEWERNWIKEVKLDENGDILAIAPFASDLPLARPIDLEVGADGALYALEWGSGFWGESAGTLVRIQPVDDLQATPDRRPNRVPQALVLSTATSGKLPLAVRFSAETSRDPDPDDVLTYAWDFDGNGTIDSTSATGAFLYEKAGAYEARLTVTDSRGASHTAGVRISAGNTAPRIAILQPRVGTPVRPGGTIAYEVTVLDDEDGEIDCQKVEIELFLRHSQHAHGLARGSGCRGTLVVPGVSHPNANVRDLSFGFEARYTDRGVAGEGGAAGVAPLQGRLSVSLGFDTTPAP
jgi:glucose/arabinose dehydrogenase